MNRRSIHDFGESTQPTSPKPIARELAAITRELQGLTRMVWMLTLLTTVSLGLLIAQLYAVGAPPTH